MLLWPKSALQFPFVYNAIWLISSLGRQNIKNLAKRHWNGWDNPLQIMKIPSVITHVVNDEPLIFFKVVCRCHMLNMKEGGLLLLYQNTWWWEMEFTVYQNRFSICYNHHIMFNFGLNLHLSSAVLSLVSISIQPRLINFGWPKFQFDLENVKY